jgi:hypothetical protein
MEKECLSCGERLVGRSDKKFCNDSCRNNYHHQKNSDDINFVRNINNILRRNRVILSQRNPEGKSRVKKITLEKSGFNFKYFTHIYTTKEGRVYYFVYDQGYVQLDNEYLTLVKNNEI